MASASSPVVVVASDDPLLLDELVRHLEEFPHWKVAAVSKSAGELQSAVASHSPDAVIVSDTLLTKLTSLGLGTSRAPALIVFGRQESAAAYKAALNLQARGFVLWPSEHRALRTLVEADIKSDRKGTNLAKLTAIWSPKAGAGASIISAYLAWALSNYGTRTTLIDLDITNADQTSILDAGKDHRTLSELLRVGDELTSSMVESIAWQTPFGFRAILSPGPSADAGLIKAPAIGRMLSSVREGSGHVVADVASGLNETSYSVIESASTLLLVVNPDFLSLKRARDAVAELRSSGLNLSRSALILNQWSNPSVTESDARGILGLPIASVIRSDMELYNSVNRRQLSERAKGTVDGLARSLLGLQQEQKSLSARLRRTKKS